MVADPKNVYDGFASLEGGVDNGRSPSLIQINQVSWSVNNTVRGGELTNRPGFVYHGLTFDSGVESNWGTGIYQGDGAWVNGNGESYSVIQINGRQFLVNLATFHVSDITPVGDSGNSPTLPHAWVTQVGSYAVVQNGLNSPVLFNGGASRRSGYNEVPIGGPMAIYNGRLFVAIAYRGNVTGNYRAGDLAYATTAGIDNMINFTETTYLAEGGDFTVPNPITGIYAISTLDTSLGYGDLLITTATNCYAFNAPIQRESWAALTYPIQRIVLKNQGALSHESLVGVNSDVFFRSFLGISDLIYAQRQQNQWGNVPISSEVRQLLQRDSPSLLGNAKGTTFDNRLLMTVIPENTSRGVIHRGLAVLDFDLISAIRDKTSPCWEGVWTGLRILSVFTASINNVQKCFAYALNYGNQIELWELSVNRPFDFDGINDLPVSRVIETRSMTFQATTNLKRLRQLDTWITNIAGETSVSVSYNTDLSKTWRPWGSWTECAAYQTCSGATCSPWINYQPQTRNRFGLLPPNGTWDDVNKQQTTDGYQFQLRLEMSGHFNIQNLRLTAEMRPENLGPTVTGTCVDNETLAVCSQGTCQTVDYCPPDDFSTFIN